MNQQLEDRIEELRNIIRKHKVKVGTKYEQYHHDGHQATHPCFDLVDVHKIKYIHPWKERRKARKELKMIKKQGPDENTRKLASKYLKNPYKLMDI